MKNETRNVVFIVSEMLCWIYLYNIGILSVGKLLNDTDVDIYKAKRAK